MYLLKFLDYLIGLIKQAGILYEEDNGGRSMKKTCIKWNDALKQALRNYIVSRRWLDKGTRQT